MDTPGRLARNNTRGRGDGAGATKRAGGGVTAARDMPARATARQRRRAGRATCLRGRDDGLEARAAEAVHDEPGRRDGAARREADVPREVRSVRGGLRHVAEDDLVHLCARGGG